MTGVEADVVADVGCRLEAGGDGFLGKRGGISARIRGIPVVFEFRL